MIWHVKKMPDIFRLRQRICFAGNVVRKIKYPHFSRKMRKNFLLQESGERRGDVPTVRKYLIFGTSEQS